MGTLIRTACRLPATENHFHTISQQMVSGWLVTIATYSAEHSTFITDLYVKHWKFSVWQHWSYFLRLGGSHGRHLNGRQRRCVKFNVELRLSHER